MESSRLGPGERRESIARLASEDWDVVVIGGGVTGAGAALDAAARGLKVALIERSDLASGTSSRSSKLLHGGLRYLEHLQFRLVREALRERSLLLGRLAPHLATAQSFYWPLTHRVWERAYIGAGVLLYDVFSGIRPGVRRHRHLTRSKLAERAPDLVTSRVRGAIRYSDVQVDDARLVLELARTARAFGAAILTRCEVSALDLADDQATLGVTDLESGEWHRMRARSVINATGVHAPHIERLAGVREPVLVQASKGVHLVVPRSAVRSDAAWISRTDKSVLFVLPWREHWIIGTTDTPYEGSLDLPQADADDVRYLLDAFNRVSARPLALEDVVATYVGLRPLVRPSRSDRDTTVLSREHVVRSPRPGLFTVVGGKLTTYRVMAKDVVDEAVAYLGLRRRSSTRRIPLAGTWPEVANERERLAAAHPELAKALPGAPGASALDVVAAVRFEGALHIEDVLMRRTRVAIETADGGLAAAPAVARIMAGELGWDAGRRKAEVERYRSRRDAAFAALADRV
jgi:glycerol-3-phosphate dehydrogenase